jgi:lycopene cyclase domain-containing protein
MAIARHGSGLVGEARALASQVHPVFMLPPVAATCFGSVIAGVPAPLAGAVHSIAVFCAVYTAHVKDGYVDFYLRDEDDDHPLTRRGCRHALVGAGLVFACCLGALWVLVGPDAVVLTVPGWLIGYWHAPQLDTNPVTATAGYPAGIALALVGGFYVQTTTLSGSILGFAVVMLVTLSGIKVIDDEQDYEFDRSIEKGTVAVVLERSRARAVARGLLLLGTVAVLWGTVDGLFPPSSPIAAVAFGAIALVATRARPELATMLLIRGAYVFLALLVAAVWYRPLASVELPDLTIFGPYTYLATELAFGVVALALLRHADAGWEAARTILVLYPVGYLWDWYTLTVGVFEIPMRTGIEFVGIPIEEHLFMIVVPAIVIGTHDTLSRGDRSSERQ